MCNKMFSVVFSNVIGNKETQLVIGNHEEVEDYATNHAASYGLAYVVYPCIATFTDNLPKQAKIIIL